jgi:hypothetical protein
MVNRYLTLIIAVLFITIPAVAQDEFGGLDKGDIKLLKGLGTTVLVPNYIPDGFTVKVVTASRPRRSDGLYTIIYVTRNGRGFVVESTSGDIGSPEADRTINVVNPMFGESFVGVFKFDGQTSAAGDWLGEGPYFRVRSVDPRNKLERRLDGGVTPETMAKIHGSLLPLR